MTGSTRNFEGAVAQARRDGQADGGVWLSLLRHLDVDEAALRRRLQEGHDIEVLPDEALLDKQELPVGVVADGVDDAVPVAVDGQRFLLCRDPWMPSVLAAVSSGRLGKVRLALAKPGQLLRAAQEVSRPVAHLPSAVEFVDRAISDARAEAASDIHFETDRTGMQLKFRMDGVMRAVERLDDPMRSEEVISRIKVMAQLDITERRRPQDGRIHWAPAGQAPMDLRVSVMPSIFGEDAVLRLLDKAQLKAGEGSLTLSRLGFDERDARRLRELAARPHGMLLMTGPTGSGKTTTVYAALSEANTGLEKTITIEDPVEYELPGVLQIPVNEKKGLTFATGLRSILRHDPDKILVGEIRDAETAQIAVQSALTGHLVFTTVHANSLFDVLGRFTHFGIEPFALASALNAVVVQRLLRAVCPHCVRARPLTPEEGRLWLDAEAATLSQVPQAGGCDHCRGTGYRGRFVVAEVHEMDDRLRDMLIAGRSVVELKTLLYADAGTTLLGKALTDVRAGRTTLEEVSRVVGLAA